MAPQSAVTRLSKMPTEIDLEVFVYNAVGDLELGKDGKPKTETVSLQKPTAAEGQQLDIWRRGKLGKKGKAKDVPSQHAVVAACVRLCLVGAEDLSEDQLNNVIIQTGGYSGLRARLARAAMRLCGQMHDSEFMDDSDADDKDEDEGLPPRIARATGDTKQGVTEDDLPT